MEYEIGARRDERLCRASAMALALAANTEAVLKAPAAYTPHAPAAEIKPGFDATPDFKFRFFDSAFATFARVLRPESAIEQAGFCKLTNLEWLVSARYCPRSLTDAQWATIERWYMRNGFAETHFLRLTARL